MYPSRDPAAPVIDPIARSCPALHAGVVVAALLDVSGAIEALFGPSARTVAKAPTPSATIIVPMTTEFIATRRRNRASSAGGTLRCVGTSSASSPSSVRNLLSSMVLIDPHSRSLSAASPARATQATSPFRAGNR